MLFFSVSLFLSWCITWNCSFSELGLFFLLVNFIPHRPKSSWDRAFVNLWVSFAFRFIFSYCLPLFIWQHENVFDSCSLRDILKLMTFPIFFKIWWHTNFCGRTRGSSQPRSKFRSILKSFSVNLIIYSQLLFSCYIKVNPHYIISYFNFVCYFAAIFLQKKKSCLINGFGLNPEFNQ